MKYHLKIYNMKYPSSLPIFMLLLLQNFTRVDTKNISRSTRFLFDSFFGLESLDEFDSDDTVGPKVCSCGMYLYSI